MADQLEQVSAEELLWELRRREALQVPGAAPAGMKAVDQLAGVETERLVGRLLDQQKVIYGVDDRKDLFEVTDEAVLRDADAVVALFSDYDVVDNGDGTSTLSTFSHGEAHNVCSSERFHDQPTNAWCSGFLVAPDLVATAGHCIGDDSPLPETRFVFGFRMVDATTATTTVSNDEVYRGVRLLGRAMTDDGTDWAVVQLDRVVQEHTPVRVRLAGRVPAQAPLHVIGHPSRAADQVRPGRGGARQRTRCLLRREPRHLRRQLRLGGVRRQHSPGRGDPGPRGDGLRRAGRLSGLPGLPLHRLPGRGRDAGRRVRAAGHRLHHAVQPALAGRTRRQHGVDGRWRGR